MHKFRVTFLILLILVLSSRVADGEFPGMFIAEGTEAPGRVLKFHHEVLERSFSRSDLNHSTHTTRIGSIEFVSSDEFYLCSGDDSVLIHRSRVGETAFYISPNLVKQVRCDAMEQIWWSELAKEPKSEDPTLGALWRWNEGKKKAEMVHQIQKSHVNGTWNGAFDICKERVLVATAGDKSTIYDISNSKGYKQILETQIHIRTFRWDASGKVWLVDDRGRLILLPNARIPSRFEVALSSHSEFTDFDFQAAR